MSVKAIAVNPENPSTFVEITPPMPQPGEHDLLVEVKAFSGGMPAVSYKPLGLASPDSNRVTKCGTRGISPVRAVIPRTS